MRDDMYARLRNAARRIMGIARCSVCGRYMSVAGDSVLDAREDLRDEGWIELVEWDGRDETALTSWQCCD